MKERITIVIIAIFVGLLITTIGFFLYNSTKVISKSTGSGQSADVTPIASDMSKTFVKVTDPADESLTTTRTIVVKGKTNPTNTLIVSTNQTDVAATPSSLGDFSVTVTIDAGVNKIITRGIAPNGDEAQDTRIITYSTEDF